mmetsp:Transcript_17495/g.12494  ORF Transcript_17495/g.12494 Transcript_17495/m.12494 type:complete len:109 (-) Transcript_17495:159-485(-)
MKYSSLLSVLLVVAILWQSSLQTLKINEFRQTPYYEEFVRIASQIDHKHNYGVLASDLLSMAESRMPWVRQEENDTKKNNSFYNFLMDVSSILIVPGTAGFLNMSMYD